MISWADFQKNNKDTTNAFENMCRSIFKEDFCYPKTILHSNHNNPGVEVEPVLGIDNKRISFQAKYFSSESSDIYTQIKDSMEKAIKYYSGKLDIIYLYSNKSLSKGSSNYKKCEKLLLENDIQLIPICNEEILDNVIHKPFIRDNYFSDYSLSKEWFELKHTNSINSLGKKYNIKFNVKTNTENSLDVFCTTSQFFNNIKTRFTSAINQINKFYIDEDYFLFLNSLKEDLCKIIDNFEDSLGYILSATDNLETNYKDNLAKLDCLLDNLYRDLYLNEENINNNDSHYKINRISEIIDLYQNTVLSTFEKDLIDAKILFINGEAGIGKSHLMGHISTKLLESGFPNIILLGSDFINDIQVQTSILDILQISNKDFTVFLNHLEEIGNTTNHSVVIFIDAINESKIIDIWKFGINSIYNSIMKYKHIKFVFSYRNGFERRLLPDTMQGHSRIEKVKKIVHKGFKEVDDNAVRTFLDHYNIPFAPSYYFNEEMKNPLYLTMFCKVNANSNTSISELFIRFIDQIDDYVKHENNLDYAFDILKSFLKEFIDEEIKTNSTFINQDTILNFKFWSTNGISNKWKYLTSLVNSNLLLKDCQEEDDGYTITYQLLNDYLMAKQIIKNSKDYNHLISTLIEYFEINNGEIENQTFYTAITFISELSYKKYKKDCIWDIFELLTNKYQVEDLANSYIYSFLLRSNTNINIDDFKKICNNPKYQINADTIFEILLQNSLKENHPLNINFLNNALIDLPLIIRDYTWTNFINFSNNNSRIMQLILSLDSGETEFSFIRKNPYSILLLFSWCLTSTNRFFRDKCSKAMIEILKEDISYCKLLLQHFENINDPYIIQRLYGIILGAILKRINKQNGPFKDLALYIYETIFDPLNSHEVYPDILLRDYARLILDRWIYENPAQSDIKYSKIIPPYNSSDIPTLHDFNYIDELDHSSALWEVAMSMAPPKDYSPAEDFGRYIFNTAIDNFDNVDSWNAYLYCMKYIQKDLGLSNEYKEPNKSRILPYNRYQIKKIERIGKKYQWISFYNCLSKISDNHLIKDYNGKKKQYEGPWEPYVRDFDPTLNENFLLDKHSTPIIRHKPIKPEFLELKSIDNSKIIEWANKPTETFDIIKEPLIIKCNDNIDWVILEQGINFSNDSVLSDNTPCKQIIWRQARCYFINKSKLNSLVIHLKSKNLDGRWFPEPNNGTYTFYNREYYWSSSLHEFIDHERLYYELTTCREIELEEYNSIKDKARLSNIVDILPAFNYFLWEQEYDASQEKAISKTIPCGKLVNFLKLEQKVFDGHFYDNNTLVAYEDSQLGLIIRKDYLEKFLKSNGYEIFWTIIGEKQYIINHMFQSHSEWSGIHFINDYNNKVEGNITRFISAKGINNH